MNDGGWSEQRGDQRRERRHNLLMPAASLLGRDQDLKALCQMLRNGNARLLTLTGHGGIGKTRLALETAHRVVDAFSDGVWWVDLGTLSDADRVPAAIAMALQVPERGGRSPLEALTDALRNRSLLLVLDNVEQVRSAAPEIGQVLARCAGVRVLATGRTPLALREEQQYAVQPLDFPDPAGGVTPERVLAASASGLFVQRAQAIQPSFALTDNTAPVIAEICRHLEGLPLAIELAATQVHVLTVEALLNRLRQRLPLVNSGAVDLPDRQRTMEQTLAWSHDLLGPNEQELFRRLAVCEGGFSLEAAVALGAGDEWQEIDVLTGLSGLVTQSLVRRGDSFGEPRYSMLELTRVHALDRLDGSGDRALVQQRHAHYFLGLAEQVEAGLQGADTAKWMRRLELEHSNLRAALAWILEFGDAKAVGRLAGVLGTFWFTRGYLSEGRFWMERAILALGDAQVVERAGTLRALSAIVGAQGDHAYEEALARDALALSRRLGDEPSIAWSLHTLGAGAHRRGDVSGAVLAYEEALALFRRVEDRNGMAAALNNHGLVAAERGDGVLARHLVDEALALYRTQGNQRGIAIALCNVGQRVVDLEGGQAAIGYYSEALALFHAIGDQAGVAWGLQAVAEVIAQGDPARAARLYGAAESLRERMGWRFPGRQLAEYSQVLDVLRERLDEPALSGEWEAGRQLSVEQAVAQASAWGDDGNVVSAGKAEARLAAGLSARETEVLRLVASGLTSTRIAEELYLSTHTVNSHLRRIYRKLGLSSRSAATRFAVDHGIA